MQSKEHENRGISKDHSPGLNPKTDLVEVLKRLRLSQGWTRRSDFQDRTRIHDFRSRTQSGILISSSDVETTGLKIRKGQQLKDFL
jgi:hypothetical protein